MVGVLIIKYCYHPLHLSLQIIIHDTTPENFLAFLEYLYTDHSPIEDEDSVGILELSNKYVMPRLMTLCELYISKQVEKATAQSIAKADVDVVGKSSAYYNYSTIPNTHNTLGMHLYCDSYDCNKNNVMYFLSMYTLA